MHLERGWSISLEHMCGEGWERGFMVIRVRRMVRISTSLAFLGKVGLGLRQVVIRMRKCNMGKSDKQENRRALREIGSSWP